MMQKNHNDFFTTFTIGEKWQFAIDSLTSPRKQGSGSHQ